MTGRSEDQSDRGGNRYSWVLWVLMAVVLVGAARYFDAAARLREALEWISRMGITGMGAYVVLYVLATVLFLPGWVLSLGAGTVYGLGQGIVLVSLSATLGATAAFLTGRYLARKWVAQRIEARAGFKAIDEAVAREGWKIVGLTRLSPVFPFNLLNYAYGVTRVSLRDYVLATWIGMLPGTVLYVYLGSLVRDVASLSASGDRVRTPVEWGFYGLGLIATVLVTLWITRIARRALGQRVSKPISDPPRPSS